MARIRFGGGGGVGADDGGETVGETQGLEQRHRQVRAFVGAHRETGAGGRESVERRDQAGERTAMVGDVRAVVIDEAVEQAIEGRIVRRRARRLEAPRDQRPRALPDHRTR